MDLKHKTEEQEEENEVRQKYRKWTRVTNGSLIFLFFLLNSFFGATFKSKKKEKPPFY